MDKKRNQWKSYLNNDRLLLSIAVILAIIISLGICVYRKNNPNGFVQDMLWCLMWTFLGAAFRGALQLLQWWLNFPVDKDVVLIRYLKYASIAIPSSVIVFALLHSYVYRDRLGLFNFLSAPICWVIGFEVYLLIGLPRKLLENFLHDPNKK